MTMMVQLVLVLLFWGAWPILTLVATSRTTPFAALLIGFLAGALAILPLALSEGREHAVDAGAVGASVAAGLAFTAGMALFYRLVATASVSTVTVVSGLYPMVTVLLAWSLLGEALPPARIVGVILALVAIVLLTRG